jgi:hypothetical protein
MSKRLAFRICLLSGLAAIASGGCAFIHYDKGAGPPAAPADPTTQPPAAAVPAGAERTALSSLAAQVGGPGGGWIIAATPQHIDQHTLGSAQQANRLAEQQPARPADAERSDSCDLNGDGFVTMDEVLALKRAGLTTEQLITRVRKTPQVFSLTDRQQQYLRDRGISQAVIDVMLSSGGQPGRNF